MRFSDKACGILVKSIVSFVNSAALAAWYKGETAQASLRPLCMGKTAVEGGFVFACSVILASLARAG
jgi:hypothetical protein